MLLKSISKTNIEYSSIDSGPRTISLQIVAQLAKAIPSQQSWCPNVIIALAHQQCGSSHCGHVIYLMILFLFLLVFKQYWDLQSIECREFIPIRAVKWYFSMSFSLHWSRKWGMGFYLVECLQLVIGGISHDLFILAYSASSTISYVCCMVCRTWLWSSLPWWHR